MATLVDYEREKSRRPALGSISHRAARSTAQSALLTLGQFGYARTSLRDIAANSEFSHGVVHYYFADKTELITYCALLQGPVRHSV